MRGGRGLALAGVGLIAVVVLVLVEQTAGGVCQRIAGGVGVVEAQLLRQHLADLLHGLSDVLVAWCEVAGKPE